MDSRSAALADKAEITEVLYRYCRAIDRCDKDLLRSVYHPDAQDNHGVFIGNGWEFTEWIMPLLKKMGVTSHSLTNILIEVKGDVAYAESYVTAFHGSVPDERGEPLDIVAGGRYVDRFERRGGEWKIADRVVVVDWNQNIPTTERWEGPMHGRWRPRGERDRNDTSYQRLKGFNFGTAL